MSSHLMILGALIAAAAAVPGTAVAGAVVNDHHCDPPPGQQTVSNLLPGLSQGVTPSFTVDGLGPGTQGGNVAEMYRDVFISVVNVLPPGTYSTVDTLCDAVPSFI